MSEKTIEIVENTISRRRFIATAGLTAAGLAIGATTFGLAGCSTAESVSEAPILPWQYKELDPLAAAKRGYDGYFEGACCYGVFDSVVGQLQDRVGAPFTGIPTAMMKYGEGGVVGWGTLCGALNGAGAAISLVTDSETYAKVINELMAWYTQTALPIYVPEGQSAIVTSVSNSPLCHASVTKWCDAAGFGAMSPERKERCGRLTGTVAGKVAELLNAVAAGTFTPSFGLAESVTGCMSCHGKGAMNNTLGKMDCTSCHKPHNGG